VTDAEPIEQPGARLSIWRDAASLEGLKTAALGAFSCETAEAGAALLSQTAERLAAEGFKAVVGPMDGDTWAYHRLVVESDGRAPFPLEPSNPPHYPAAFEQAGWPVIGRYISSEGQVEARAQTRTAPGLTIRSLNVADADQEMRRVHALSLQAFSGNFLYRPTPEEKFVASYKPFLPFIDAELALVAQDADGEMRGFLFSYPDVGSGALVLKTYASLTPGAGSMLVSELYRRAHDKGYHRVIHALMHEANLSARHSQNVGGQVFRRYALWGRKL